jgi:hypothetical protein
MIDDIDERSRAEQSRPEQGEDAPATQEMFRATPGKCLDELAISGGSEKGERREQRSGADAGDQLEIRSLAPFAEPDERTRSERTGAAASGERQNIYVTVGRSLPQSFDQFRSLRVYRPLVDA